MLGSQNSLLQPWLGWRALTSLLYSNLVLKLPLSGKASWDSLPLTRKQWKGRTWRKSQFGVVVFLCLFVCFLITGYYLHLKTAGKSWPLHHLQFPKTWHSTERVVFLWRVLRDHCSSASAWSSAGRQLQGWSSLRPKSLSPLPGSDINMSLNVCESSCAAVLRLLWASYLPKSPLSQNPLCSLLNADPSLAFRMAICPLLPSSLTLGLVPKLL